MRIGQSLGIPTTWVAREHLRDRAAGESVLGQRPAELQLTVFFGALRDWRAPGKGLGTPPQTIDTQCRDYTQIFEGERELRGRSAKPLGWWIGIHRLHWENVMALRSRGPGLGQRDCQRTPRRNWQ
jgi:hypothetical protein